MRIGALVLAALFGSCSSQPTFRGPMRVRNQHPAQLTVLEMTPQGAEPLPPQSAQVYLDAAYTSLFLTGQGNGNTFQMDGEILRLAPGVKVGYGSGIEMQVELPVAITGGGFLDTFIVNWHDIWGLPDQGRETTPQNRYIVQATRQGQVAYEMDNSSLALMDIPLVLTWDFLPVTEERPYGLGVRGGIELPTGDQDRGFGNGGLDYALGLVGEYRYEWVSLTGFAEYTWASTPDMAREAGLTFGDVASFGLGAEMVLSDTWSLLVQTEYESSVLRNLDFPRVSDDQWLLWVGGRARFDRWYFEVAIGEDLSPFVAPDFSIWLSMTFDFGG